MFGHVFSEGFLAFQVIDVRFSCRFVESRVVGIIMTVIKTLIYRLRSRVYIEIAEITKVDFNRLDAMVIEIFKKFLNENRRILTVEWKVSL